MDRIELRGMRFEGRHGVRDRERTAPQRFEVDVEVECDVSRAGRTDDLADSVDYREIRSIAKSAVEGPSVKLIETLATRIAGEVLRLDHVAAVSVRVVKHPASMEPIDSTAVVIKRTRA